MDADKTLSPFVLGRLGEALRGRYDIRPTLPSRLYSLTEQLRQRAPAGTPEADGDKDKEVD